VIDPALLHGPLVGPNGCYLKLTPVAFDNRVRRLANRQRDARSHVPGTLARLRKRMEFRLRHRLDEPATEPAADLFDALHALDRVPGVE
jgi:hypothetical protein